MLKIITKPRTKEIIIKMTFTRLILKGLKGDRDVIFWNFKEGQRKRIWRQITTLL